MAHRIEIVGTVIKASDADEVVYGHAVIVSVDGGEYFDLQGDNVDMDSLRKCATQFMRTSRLGKRMHTGGPAGEIVHSLPLDADLAKAYEIETKKLGWLIGFLPGTEEVAKQFRDGTLKGFSIGGWGERVEIDDNGVAGVGKRERVGKRGTAAKAKKYRLVLSKIDEVSGVDRPAQEYAMVALIKHADGTTTRPGVRVLIAKADEVVAKGVWLTTEADGHTHLLSTEDYDGTIRTSGSTDYRLSDENDMGGHSHPWIQLDDGTIKIGAASGHTHELDEDAVDVPVPEDESDDVPTSPNVEVLQGAPGSTANPTPTSGRRAVKRGSSKNPDPKPPTPNDGDRAMPMTPDEEKTFKRALALAEMTDTEKLYFSKMAASDQEALIAKTASERRAAIGAAVALDDVVYTVKTGDLKGRVFRKSDDQTVVAAVKMADDATERAEKSDREASDAVMKNLAASTIPMLAGTADEHVEVMKAVAKIPDETKRASVLTTLKSANAALETLGKRVGAQSPAVPSSARAKLQKMADDKAKAENKHPAVAKYELIATDNVAKELMIQIDAEDRAEAARARASM